VRSEGIYCISMKNPMTPAGIEPANHIGSRRLNTGWDIFRGVRQIVIKKLTFSFFTSLSVSPTLPHGTCLTKCYISVLFENLLINLKFQYNFIKMTRITDTTQEEISTFMIISQ